MLILTVHWNAATRPTKAGNQSEFRKSLVCHKSDMSGHPEKYLCSSTDNPDLYLSVASTPVDATSLSTRNQICLGADPKYKKPAPACSFFFCLSESAHSIIPCCSVFSLSLFPGARLPHVDHVQSGRAGRRASRRQGPGEPSQLCDEAGERRAVETGRVSAHTAYLASRTPLALHTLARSFFISLQSGSLQTGISQWQTDAVCSYCSVQG